MKKKLINLGGSKAVVLPADIVSDLEEVDVDLDTINRKIIISW